jgi:hypothetical protein
MKHQLDIISLHDGHAACSCGGWTYAPPAAQPVYLLDVETAHRKHRFAMSKVGRLHGYQVFGAKHGRKRITRGTLDGKHGAHTGLNLIVQMLDGDVIEMRPLRSPKRHVISIFDVYDFALKREADAVRMEKVRAARAKNAGRIGRLRIRVQRHKLKEI